MKKNILKFSLACIILFVAGSATAQAIGSVSALGGTAGSSAFGNSLDNTDATVSETLYIGPGDYIINGTWEIYSKNIWISPLANISGTGTIKYFNPSVAGGAASPTLIDGNNNSIFINVNVENQNASNIVLTDITTAGTDVPGWTDAIGNANITFGKGFNFAVANGDVILGNFDMITATAATLSGYQPDRFAVTNGTGHLVHQNYTGAFTYPVGKAEGDYTPAAINSTTANTYHVLVQDYATSTSFETGTSGMDRTWNIYSDNAAASATVDLQHNTATNLAAFNNASHFVTRWSGTTPNATGDVATSVTAWQSNTLIAGTTGALSSTGAVAGSIETSHTYTSFATTATDPIAYYSKSSNPIQTLPIILVSFTGGAVNCNGELTWKTAEEVNGKYFEVQRSTDGINFIAVTQVTTRASYSTYYYTDAAAPRGSVYYRLRIVDKNGRVEFGNTVVVKINCNNPVEITAYPNPVKNIVTISGLSGKSQLRLLDIAGKVLTRVEATGTVQQLDISKYPSGTYMLQIVQGNKIVQNIKLNKQ